MTWPSPEKATLLFVGGTLDLPVRLTRPPTRLRCPVPSRRARRRRPYSLAVTCESSASTALVWNWAQRVIPGIMSRRMTPLAQSLNCDGPKRCRGMHGKSASTRGCSCHARATRLGRSKSSLLSPMGSRHSSRFQMTIQVSGLIAQCMGRVGTRTTSAMQHSVGKPGSR